MVRFNHENVIDIRDILRSSSLDSMKDVYIVQVESPNNRKVFQAKWKWKPLSPPVPDGDRLVQAAENPATKQWPHLLLPLSGFFNFLSLMGYYGLIRRRGSHVKIEFISFQCWMLMYNCVKRAIIPFLWGAQSEIYFLPLKLNFHLFASDQVASFQSRENRQRPPASQFLFRKDYNDIFKRWS